MDKRADSQYSLRVEKTQIYSKVGSGPDLLFLHGWQHDRHTWDGVVQYLKDDFTCWLVDLPGFGQNPRPKTVWNITNYAQWVGEFITEHQLKNPVVVGHSFGGRIAIVLTAEPVDNKNVTRSTLHVSRLVLYATPGVRQPISSFHSLAQALYRGVKKTGIPISQSKLFKKMQQKLRSQDYNQSGNMQDIFLATINFDLEPYLSQIPTPTLLLWGENDAIVPLTIGHAMHQIIPESDMKVIPKTTHLAHLEQPRLFSGYIRNFAGEAPSTKHQ